MTSSVLYFCSTCGLELSFPCSSGYFSIRRSLSTISVRKMFFDFCRSRTPGSQKKDRISTGCTEISPRPFSFEESHFTCQMSVPCLSFVHWLSE